MELILSDKDKKMGKLSGIFRKQEQKGLKKETWLPGELYRNRRLVLSLAKMILKQNMQVLILEPSGFRSAGGNNSGILVCIFSGVPVQHR